MKVRSAPAKAFQLLIELPPLFRRFLLIAIDAILLPLAVLLSFWLRLEQLSYPSISAVGSWLLPSVILWLSLCLCRPIQRTYSLCR